MLTKIFKVGYFLSSVEFVFLVYSADILFIVASPGQRKGACNHTMASFDQHSRYARCRDKGQGDDACVKKLPCEFCELVTPEQVLQLSTPSYKPRKEKKQERESLVDPSTVTVLSSVDQDKSVGASSSLNTSEDLSLLQPSFKKIYMT